MHFDQPAAENTGLERTRHQLRATGVKEVSTAKLRSGIHSRGYLPHVKRDGSCYFVTFRLADSLPKEVLMGFLREKCERLKRRAPSNHTQTDNHSDKEISRDAQRKIERYLDSGAGSCHLQHPRIAELVASALKHFHEERYILNDWVIMPNHVHVIVQPIGNFLLTDILKSWKQFTARHAKEKLNLGQSQFWQHESYDHWIRSDDEKARIARYIRNNPVIARLCERPEDWRWSSAWKRTPVAQASEL